MTETLNNESAIRWFSEKNVHFADKICNAVGQIKINSVIKDVSTLHAYCKRLVLEVLGSWVRKSC